MSILAARHPWPESESAWDYGATRLLELLDNGDAALTLEQARQQGIEMPAQAIYALRLAGYVIDRVPRGDQFGDPAGAYRLRTVVRAPDERLPLPTYEP